MSLATNFGIGGASVIQDAKNSVRALPASWYTSPEMYELERRAVFSKKWLLTTHSLRLLESGDWIRYDVAGFQFIIVKDRQGQIRGFHNVCRHRAFPIVTDEKGHNSIFACKYHGWSYGLNGKLAKAPGYQDLEGFDKSQNGLWPVHIHVDDKGFIWANLDGGEKPEIAWADDFDRVDQEAIFSGYNFDDYVFDHTWEMDGEYNWKILANNYNESHNPAVEDQVKTKNAYTQHFGKPMPDQAAQGLTAASTFYFPNASTNISPHFFFMQRFVPTSATKSTLRYEVFRNKNASDEEFDVVNKLYKRILSEDKHLYASTQKNLNAGTNSETENSSLIFQTSLRDCVTAHHTREAEADCEIWPARQNLPKSASTSKNDMDFCSNVDCCRINKGPIAV
ncbi:Rieske [2Fe-2S] domain protein [Thelonectria olida]|uniref:Choline monooxygenase, chloroplastic n=1 Tax=Thelonectria olida TaxID=1576542 RepID=A0A9P8W4J7_9HYPO|nr:Rieske [2Fe-2S] domain protein [Thelonectria olida]